MRLFADSTLLLTVQGPDECATVYAIWDISDTEWDCVARFRVYDVMTDILSEDSIAVDTDPALREHTIFAVCAGV